MNRTAWIAVCLSAALAIAQSAICRANAPGTVQGWLGAAALSQVKIDTKKANQASRDDAARFLRQARTAMEQGYLETADRFVTKAEQLGVSYGMLYPGDTPKKARRDLNHLQELARRSASKAPPRGKGGLREQQPEQEKSEVQQTADARPRARSSVNEDASPATAPSRTELDPIARERTEPALAAVPAPGQPRALPGANEPGGMMTSPPEPEQIESFGMSQAVAPRAAGASGVHPLLAARRALAAGNLQAAAASLAQAKQAPPAGNRDTAAAVSILLEKQTALNEALAAGENSDTTRRELANSMLDQAEGLLRWNDLDSAERIATKTLGLRIEYGPFERSPQAILQRIAHQRGGPQQVIHAAHQEPVHREAGGVQFGDYQEPIAPAGSQQNPQAAQASFDFPSDDVDSSPFGEQLPPPVAQPPAAHRGRPANRPVETMNAPNRAGGNNQAALFLERGEMALQGGDVQTARAYFEKAKKSERQLSAAEQNRLTQYLSLARKQQEENQSRLDANVQPPPAVPPVAITEEVGPPAASAEERSADDQNSAPETMNPAAEPVSTPDPQPAMAAPSGQRGAEAAPPTNPPQRLPAALAPGALLNQYSAGQVLLYKKFSAEVANQQSRARQMQESDPRGALELLKKTKDMIEQAKLEPQERDQLLRKVARTTEDVQAYFDAHRAEIELDEKNQATVDRIDRERQTKQEIDEKLAALVEEYNTLADQEMWPQAELVAKKAIALAPKNPIAEQLRWNANFVRRYNQARRIELAKEDGFVRALEAVDESDIPFDDRNPINFGDKKHWEEISDRRKSFAEGDRPRRNDRERQIEQKLKTPVSLQYTEAPLTRVLADLGDLAGINIHVDTEGLAAEGVATDTPVTINLKQDISLKSALNLILQQYHLGYVIKDEVLKITSEQYRNGELVPVMYSVADLVIPIPNFVPGPHMGLAGSIHEAYTGLGYGGTNSFNRQSPTVVLANNDGTPSGSGVNPQLLASVGSSASTMAGTMLGKEVPLGAGPGGAGGGVSADFDSLVQLITSTIAPTTWDEVGGSATIEEFRTNLSLVISQTEDVHDQIRDLLAQLRRLQDLQVTIEVRFITLNDNFFERIGVDFDFNINQNPAGGPFGQLDPQGGVAFTTPPSSGTFNFIGRNFTAPNLSNNQTTVAGLQQPGIFSNDLDIPFTQNSFGLAVPQFGGFDPTAGASIGFAILSEIETYFFINAAEGDNRTNILQAPKVTLFNGQLATVADISQSPFVISVIPVVGDFAAAQQPVIVVLNEGTYMTVQATVSSDRRFVRMTVVPYFSKINNVSTFTFEGSNSSITNSSSDGPADQTTQRASNTQTTSSGTTVQLPTLASVTVSTTVSVPDGGTILLGGVKRLREGRNELGVPILSKLPYINRLFKNVSIGRETQSLMMMVTPRIIIQEEEESLLGITPGTP